MLRLSFKSPLSKPLFMDILKVGAMSSLSTLQTVATILILTRLISSFGPEALAGYGIGTRLEFLLVPMTFAFGVACVPMVGMALGAQLFERAKKVAWAG
jgi:Na+-driven multidrug efflux pump